MGGEVPLTTLLSWVWEAFTIEVDNACEAAAQRDGRLFRISMAMWANGLRLIDDDGTTVAALQESAGARCNLPGLERWGWVRVGSAPSARRPGYGTRTGIHPSTVLRPTRAGAYARRLWPAQVAAVEDRWEGRFGKEALASLRRALSPLAAGMPWSPPETHPSDGFFAHVVPGPRPDQGSGTPLVGLLGQALTALTLRHEDGAEVSLPLAANVLRVVGTGAVATRELPALGGISKEAVAMAVGYITRHHLAETRDRSVRLSAAGLDALDGYEVRAGRAQDKTLRAALGHVLAQHEALGEGLVPPAGCWRGEKPYLVQTRRVLAGLPSTLPWHPMVLHRGGWPDGA